MPPESLTCIEISKEYLNFSAGHFTIFSATERENLHGHNFQVRCAVTAGIGPDGLAFDYVLLKRVLRDLCDALDERVLLPELSPYLALEHQDGMVVARFADERIPFLARDCLELPIRNVTIEELAGLLVIRLRARPELTGLDLRALEIGVSSSPGQWAFSHWESA
ncbi:6-carboxytetrahydropterin synthase [uncultured Thiodictyon sp.]|uniref:6-pyruvoyl trahydropterin synthase family protein n=1 Tax=uncultured Thiodictyon sp. TaxID=1846217 RepID=UPI0025D6FFC5|nr:6-carboxytetrahydropterin synthase [uncultured Thiodictyon sp.]